MQYIRKRTILFINQLPVIHAEKQLKPFAAGLEQFDEEVSRICSMEQPMVLEAAAHGDIIHALFRKRGSVHASREQKGVFRLAGVRGKQVLKVSDKGKTGVDPDKREIRSSL